MRKRRAFLLAAALCLLAASCGKPDGGGDNLSMEYLGRVFSTDVSAAFLDVSYDGKIFLMESAMGSGSSIRIYGSDGEDLGTLKDAAGDDVIGRAFFIDRSNLVNVFDVGFWAANKRYRYTTNGVFYDELPLDVSLADIPISDNGSAVAKDGSILCVQTMTDYVSALGLAVLSEGLTVKRQIDGAEVAKLIPGFAEEGAEQGNGSVITGIAPGSDGEILLSIEMTTDAVDGVLVLNKDFSVKRYFGADWTFNGPFDLAMDGSGYYYVVNMYHNAVKAFDSDWNLMHETDAWDSEDPKLDNPSLIRIRGNDIYVFDGGGADSDHPYAVHHFKTLTSNPKETAEPYSAPVVPPVVPNSDPVIDSIDLIAMPTYDSDSNYMGGTFTYMASASDADGDSLEYSWELLTTNETASLSQSASTAIVETDSFGSGQLRLTVSDSKGGTAIMLTDSFGPP